MIPTLYTSVDCISLGKEKLDLEKFSPVRYGKYSRYKPVGGLWASPLKSRRSWYSWCVAEDFAPMEYLRKGIILKVTGKFAVIDSVENLKKIPIFPDFSGTIVSIDFYRLIEEGYDALWLTAEGEASTRFGKPSLYGWDCETVYIMNKNSIVFWETAKPEEIPFLCDWKMENEYTK